MKHLKSLTTIAAAAIAATVGSGIATAQVVSVNIMQNAGNDNQQIDADETFGIAGYGSVVGGWHNINAATPNLLNNLGAATTLDFSLTQPNGQATFNIAYADTPLFAGLDDYTTTVNPTTLTVSDINATFTGGYLAIVYLGGFNANLGSAITDGTSTFFYRPLPAPVAPVSFVQTTQTTDLGSGSNPIAQYAVFGSISSPLTANSITFTLDTLYSSGAGIGGVQIVGVPEPTTAALLLSGAILMARRQRKA